MVCQKGKRIQRQEIMSSRDSILNKIKNNQPSAINELPDLSTIGLEKFDVIETYKTVLKGIGGPVALLAKSLKKTPKCLRSGTNFSNPIQAI